ncbi:MAG: PadR family transcriptional regulator [Streptococcaceae bacterium]|jgi:DNA-binding PadR family transcriptional regulator|nr:PadR family transcriptional regulator [Streptococcaceae bacterium]
MSENEAEYVAIGPEIPKEMLRAQANVILLTILEQGDNYIYGILKTVRAVSGGEFEIPEGTLYALFKRLERDGIVESYWGDESGGSRRKYYRMTAQGRSNMQLAGESWRKVDAMIEKIKSGSYSETTDKNPVS